MKTLKRQIRVEALPTEDLQEEVLEIGVALGEVLEVLVEIEAIGR
jgi:hypothetical protein